MSCFRKRPPNVWITAEGHVYIAISLALSLLAWKVWGHLSFLPLFGLTLYLASFFRNPRREIPQEEDIFIAPADGKVLEVEECEESRYLKKKAKRVSIFMSPFNCHMNRIPVSGKVLACYYKEGTFAAAFKKKAMDYNEHHAVLLEDQRGGRWLVVQIAGWLARRIVSYVKEGDQLSKGERFGLIQFGSRTDLYCPAGVEIFVRPGEKVYGGKTVLGRVL